MLDYYLFLPIALSYCAVVGAASGWQFVQNGTSGVLALEAIIVSPTLAIFFDRATNDPLQVNGHPAWGALFNLETNTATALDVVSDSFCASGSRLSNGTMVRLSRDTISTRSLTTFFKVSVGGNIPVIDAASDGRMGIRIFEPCASPSGANCTLFEDPKTVHLAETRWYPSSLRIFDGSLVCTAKLPCLFPSP